MPQGLVPTRPSGQASSAVNLSIFGDQNPVSSNIEEQRSSAIEARGDLQYRQAASQQLLHAAHDTHLRQIETLRGSLLGSTSTTRPRPNPVTPEEVVRVQAEQTHLEGQQSPLLHRTLVFNNRPGAAQPLNTAFTDRPDGPAPPSYRDSAHTLRYDHDTFHTSARRLEGGQIQSRNTPNPIYQTFGPDGHCAVAFPTGSTAIGPQPSVSTVNVALGANANPADRAMAENIVHQAVINNEQRRRDANANAPGIGRFMSRIWLFIRLYFFCYVISAPGTWTRIFFVTAALLISLLSDTDIPQMLYGLIVQPVQHHLEGLARMGGPGQPTTQGRGDGPRDGLLGEVSDYFRRAERSIVLLLASLIPGIGERQVEARNAAEAEAERVRQEARDREREQEQEQERQQAQQARIEATQDNDNVEQPQQAAAPVPAAASVTADS